MYALPQKPLGRIIAALILGSLLAAAPAAAQSDDKLGVPRFVSLRADAVNLRTGPGLRYPIDWVFIRAGLPVEIIGEFDNWRQVRAQDGTTGWVHKSMLSGHRTVAINGAADRLYREPSTRAPAAAFVERGVIVTLRYCEQDWCQVVAEKPGITGWVRREALWGVYPGEQVR